MITDLIPHEFNLNDNYPNPFNPATIISYDLPIKAQVKLEIFNVHGQKNTLVDEKQTTGYYEVVWNSK